MTEANKEGKKQSHRQTECLCG